MSPTTRTEDSDEVSPLELFFDLVAVFGVWSYTSFEASLPGIRGRVETPTILVVMFLGLFMNASISHAFENGPWAFVVPFLVSQLGHGIITASTATTRLFREHYTIMLGWILASAPLWIGGAVAGSQHRLAWWSAAAGVDIVGTWFAHPVPGRRLRSENVPFGPDHMIERCRLFLIIALGEAVLTTGSSIAGAHHSAATIAAGVLALTPIVSLWALYFGGSDHLVSRHAETTSDPLRAARMAMNGQVAWYCGPSPASTRVHAWPLQ